MLSKPLQQAIEVGAGEGPLEGPSHLLVVALEGEQALLDRGEVVEGRGRGGSASRFLERRLWHSNRRWGRGAAISRRRASPDSMKPTRLLRNVSPTVVREYADEIVPSFR